MMYLAIAKHYEPFLLVGIGFACIVANVPGSDLILPGGLFYYAYQGVALLIIPPLIFLGVGAMTDFGPMIANPKLVILGAGAHLGIFVALIGAKLIGFTINEAGAIGIIGGADGPMAIFVTMKLAPHLLPQISVAAYSYMALMPLIQPPVMKLLTTKKERQIRMAQSRKVSRLEKIAFPIVIGIIVNLFFPPVAPLITMLMLGNLLKEVRSSTAWPRPLAAGYERHHHYADRRHRLDHEGRHASSRWIRSRSLFLGLVAFVFGTGSGVVDRQDHEPVPEGEDQPADRLGRHRLRSDRRAGVACRRQQGRTRRTS